MLRLLRNEPVDDRSREVSVPIYKLEQWHDRSLAAIDAGLKDRENDPVSAQLDGRQPAHRRTRHGNRNAAQGKAGEAPFGRPEVIAMSRETSDGAGNT